MIAALLIFLMAAHFIVSVEVCLSLPLNGHSDSPRSDIMFLTFFVS